jgi:hypothetical protein
MQVNLLETIDNEASIGIPGWQEMRAPLDMLERSQAMQDLVDAHATTVRRIASADFHLHILQQVYVPDRVQSGSRTILWAQAGAESVIFWLYTSLNSLAHELNLVYGFGIDEFRVDVTHPQSHSERPNTNCFRCRLIMQNHEVCRNLESELSSDWFKFLNSLRNRITHRQLLSTNTNFGGPLGLFIEISHDPEAKRFDEPARQGIEISRYCLETRHNVIRVIGEAYTNVISRIRQI